MDAGPELNALVLEKIFEFPRKKLFKPYDDCVDFYYIPSGKSRRTHMIDARPVPRFSQDIAAAWQVVEKMRDMWSAATSGVSGLDPDFPCPFDDTFFFDVLRRNADRRWPWAFLYVTPHAICLAALKAVGALE